MSPIIFTLCSNNYLAQAKTLGDSVLEFYPDSKFVIGLVDYKDDSIDYSFFKKMEILPFDELGYNVFEDMLSRYNVIEFNTSVKPYYIDYLWKTFGREQVIFYLDPDIILYQALNHVEESLKNHSVVLTPMFCEAPQETSLDELVALRHGMYNLGFIALKYSSNSIKLVEWWMERLRTHCIIDKSRGIFVDQKWMDLAPLLFDEVFVLKHKGYNMAWWNFSERKLLKSQEEYAVNKPDHLLYFFHFSGFHPRSDYVTGRSSDLKFSFDNKPELKLLAKSYEEKLLVNNYYFYNSLTPQLTFFSPKISWKRRIKKRLMKMLEHT